MQKEFKFVKHASATRRNRTTPRQTGFSLVELLVVVAVAMIIGGMCAPLLMNTVNQYQLRAASVDLDNLLQQARMKAVRDNKFYTVKTNTSNTQLFFDLNGNGSWDAGEPVVVLPRGASALPGASGGSNPSLSAATLGFTPQSSGTPIMFNARGTPCLQSAWPPWECCSEWQSWATADPRETRQAPCWRRQFWKRLRRNRPAAPPTSVSRIVILRGLRLGPLPPR